MSNFNELLWGDLDPELEEKFADLKCQLDQAEKEITNGHLNKGISKLRESAKAYRLEAENIKVELYEKRYISKNHEDLEKFFIFCERLPSVRKLRESNSLPNATRKLSLDFVLNGFKHYKHYSQATDIIIRKLMKDYPRENPLGKYERYIRRRVTINCDNAETSNNKLRRFIVDDDPEDSLKQQNSPVTLDSIKHELVDSYIIDCFSDYIKRLEKK
jgi:hypothetical protein